MDQLTTFILNHWVLCLALVIVVILLFINEMIDKKSKGKQLTPQAAVKLMNDEAAIVIDLRDADKFEQGHIVNALRASEEDLNQKRFEKYKTKPIILTCAEGIRSAKLVPTLKSKGYTALYVLAGGMQAWRNAELPTVKGR